MSTGNDGDLDRGGESNEATMRAAVIHHFGAPDAVAIARVPRPQPNDSEILVRVEACGLNILDILIRRGTPGVNVALPHVSGFDVVGTVCDGRGLPAQMLIGQRVLLHPALAEGMIGQERWGGLAEFVTAPSTAAIPLSVRSDADLHRYAALPVAYSTARRMLLSRGQLQPDEVVVVQGAGGGVGIACVQLAHLAGARVIACTSGAGKLDPLRSIGAEEVLLTTAEDVPRRVREITGGGADVVVDFLGNATWGDTLRCARVGGRIVTCGNSTGCDANTDLRYIWARELSIIGSNGWIAEDLISLVETVAAGRLEPVIHGVYPLSNVAEAMAQIENRRAFGRVIVTPD